MIEHLDDVNGEGPATVCYLLEDFTPCEKAEAQIIKVIFDSGNHLWLNVKPIVEEPKNENIL